MCLSLSWLKRTMFESPVKVAAFLRSLGLLRQTIWGTNSNNNSILNPCFVQAIHWYKSQILIGQIVCLIWYDNRRQCVTLNCPSCITELITLFFVSNKKKKIRLNPCKMQLHCTIIPGSRIKLVYKKIGSQMKSLLI